jgi:hypothetical protein
MTGIFARNTSPGESTGAELVIPAAELSPRLRVITANVEVARQTELEACHA